MRRWWCAAEALTGVREAGTTLAIFRIAVALVVIYSLLSVSSTGLVEFLWAPPEDGGYTSRLRSNWLLDALGGPSARAAWVLWTTSLLSALLLLVGVFGRATALVTLQSYAALVRINPETSGGYDALTINALWLLVLARSCATLSLECQLRHGSLRSDEQVAAWPRYLAILQLVVMYTATGLQKASLVWTPLGGYSALYWVSQDPTWLRTKADSLAWAYPLTQLATAATWWWEVLAPLLLLAFYYRATDKHGGRLRGAFNRLDFRRCWALFGIALHVGILIALNVGPFSLISLAYYVCLWRPLEWRAGWARIGAAVRAS